MKAKNWIIMFLLLAFICMAMIAAVVIYVDPFFHYHKPVEKLYYPLSSGDERYVNHGICKNFDYDAIITGSSMCENFKASQLDELFGVKTIKIPCFGASYRELDELLAAALEFNDGIRLIVRGLDGDKLFEDKDFLSYQAEIYPTYLYDSNPFNDVKYWFYSRAVEQSLSALRGYAAGAEGGITDFDSYGSWTGSFPVQTSESSEGFLPPGETLSLNNKERETISGSIRQNAVELAMAHPETEFYYFFTPYSALWWGEQYRKGNISRYIEAEELAIELMLECDNIRIFNFNTCFEMTTDMMNYKDPLHYGSWINEWILQCMADGKYMLTADNYQDCLRAEAEFYESFDYNSLFVASPAA